MNKVNRESIEQLLQSEDGASVSIYMPTHRFPTPMYAQEDTIRFKNLIKAGQEALKQQGIDDGLIAQIAHNLEELLGDLSFWQQTTEGLAVFASPAATTFFHLPMECEERVTAGDCYDITLLLALAAHDVPYYVLALAMHTPTVYKGDMYGVEPTGIELPVSPEEALGIDEMHSNSQTFRAGAAGAKSHGQGDSRQAGQEERLKFLRMIDEVLGTSKYIDVHAPFLLAGSDDETSSYMEITQLKQVLPEPLSGNYTEAVGTKTHDIHGKSWEMIKREIIQKNHADALETLGSLLGTGKASTQLNDIQIASKEGRVDRLLIEALHVTHDTVTDRNEAATVLVLPINYEVDRLADCSRAVFDQGGKVIAVAKGSLPDHAAQAAIYRY